MDTPSVAPARRVGPPRGRNGGRPVGAISKERKLQLKEQGIFNMAASRRASKILRAQTVAALGTHHMITISFDANGKRETHIVRDEKHQEKLLEEGEYGKDYLIIEGTPPDWRAGDAILNRAWGKPKETVEHTGEVQFSLVMLAAQRKNEMLDANADTKVLEEPAVLLDAPAS